jgi:predicted Zn-dependent protease
MPWAKPLIAEAVAQAAPLLQSVEAQGRFVDAACDQFVTSLLTRVGGTMSRGDQARALLVLGKTKELDAFLTDALREQPEDAELLSMMAALRAMAAERSTGWEDLLHHAREKRRSGAIREAEALYEEGMARFPREVLFWFEHAGIAHYQPDWPEAARRWERMRELFPWHQSWIMGLYVSWRQLGRIEEAEQFIESIMEQFPDFPSAAAAHAQIPLDKGDAQEALRRLKSVRQRFPDQLSSRKLLIDLLIKERALAEAREELGGLIGAGSIGPDLQALTIRLAESPDGLRWLGSVWIPLANSVTDRAWLSNQANELFDRFSPTADCDFLLPWIAKEA